MTDGPLKYSQTKPVPTNEEKTDQDNQDVSDNSIYSEILPNQVIVGRNHPLSYYIDRSKRILRMNDQLFVSGSANAISVACALVQVLKQEKFATIDKIATGMNCTPFFKTNDDLEWSNPVATIEFELKRGEFAKYISNYQQRKVIIIFEMNDKELNGYLTFKQIQDLKLDQRFRANQDQIEESKEFLSEQMEEKLDLPSFIKYASILIHPLLKLDIFISILSKEFGIKETEKPIVYKENDKEITIVYN